ncbi:transporter substrate-binding domain-containing protein [Consotaella salsifontis]|uniref:transporter substrate-binding domain-containing protein n=1 Tax=Consotaella salsifontis TaxID=1365950 RepID=UPI001FD92FBC|nr:transporter substrate-binding domain-containing protein [Consotaella salsifontis]
MHGLVTFAAAVVFWLGPAMAQQVEVPNFWDQHQRVSRPDLSERRQIRFLTSVDFPPFNFLNDRGRLSGFHVDLARAICAELGVTDRCQIQAMPFRDLGPALKAKKGDAILAGLAVTPENRREFAFTQPFFRFPARFITLKEKPLAEPMVSSLSAKTVAVVAGSAHEAMFAAFFPGLLAKPFPTRQDALEALKAGTVDALFGDGVDLSFWLSSNDAGGCCVFSGGPYLSDRFLGEGLAIAVSPDDAELATAFDYAIGRVVAKGGFSELLLRYFPVSAF